MVGTASGGCKKASMLIQFVILFGMLSGTLWSQEEEAEPPKIQIEECLNCHGRPRLTGLSSFDRRQFFTHPDDAGRPLKSDDPAFRNRLYIDPIPYLESAHKKLTCVECHQDATVPAHRLGLEPVDCRRCHALEWDDFVQSSHHAALLKEKVPGDTRPPSDCYGCHGGYHVMLFKEDSQSPVHPINRVDRCGSCHEDRLFTFRQTYHGIFERLGQEEPARCVSCHKNHLILRADDPLSSIHPANLKAVCEACHEGANENYVQFRAHLHPRSDRTQPVIYYAAWFMRWLLVVTLGFFALHSLLWFIRSIPDLAWRFRQGKNRNEGYRIRFSLFHRLVHALIMVSFFGLALTGLPLTFADHGLAQKAILTMGGLPTVRWIHRLCAFMTFAYAILHLVFLVRSWRRSRKHGSPSLLTGPDTLIPRVKDLKDLKDQWLWFFGLGPRPRFDRWTYMEKFDYWAVFWGVLFMGVTGLVLWFPMFFTVFLPGWTLNLARVVHSEEALLAVGYIFAIHFFNVHLRPLKLPMSLSMFTGRESIAEISMERPEEAERRFPGMKTPEDIVGKSPVWLSAASALLGLALLVSGIVILAVVLAGLVLVP
jgi:cytochrome b subunit of formate dehydrogenase